MIFEIYISGVVASSSYALSLLVDEHTKVKQLDLITSPVLSWIGFINLLIKDNQKETK
jgi:hypothetical protein